MQVSWWVWFHLFVFSMLILDLGVFHRKDKEISVKESLIWTLIWVACALIFNAGVYHFIGKEEASAFLTCYILEKSLSVDNIFVMTMIFGHFKVLPRFQHRVLFWGILGALVMRIIFILGGVSLISHFHFILYLFGLFLIYTGLRMLFSTEKKMNPEEGFIYRFAKKHFKMTPDFEGNKFFVKKKRYYLVTPLLLVLLIIEATDVLFALDSIPATLSVTKNSFIAYTSNIFAILGLRSLYFAFAGIIDLFRFLGKALAFVLIFIGSKMLLEKFIYIPTSASLGIVIGSIVLSMFLSVIVPKKIIAKHGRID